MVDDRAAAVPVACVHRTGELVPILRRRGILRTEFAGGGLRATLRDI